MADTKTAAAGGSSGIMPIVGVFVAGVVAVLTFHQVAIWVLHLFDVLPNVAYNFSTPTKPLGVPVVLSLAFWGGVWALPLAWLLRGRNGAGYWWVALLFGAIVVTLGAWFVVPWIKGVPTILDQPLSKRIIVGPIVNRGL